MENKVEYIFKMMSGDIIPVSFFYNDEKSFKALFILECRKAFPDILYDQLKLFDKEGNLYDISYIPENGCEFNVFISERIVKSVLDYSDYSDVSKTTAYRTYILWIAKEKNKFSVIFVYSGLERNMVMSSSFRTEREFFRRINDIEDPWKFIDEKSYLRCVFETGLTDIKF